MAIKVTKLAIAIQAIKFVHAYDHEPLLIKQGIEQFANAQESCFF